VARWQPAEAQKSDHGRRDPVRQWARIDRLANHLATRHPRQLKNELTSAGPTHRCRYVVPYILTRLPFPYQYPGLEYKVIISSSSAGARVSPSGPAPSGQRAVPGDRRMSRTLKAWPFLAPTFIFVGTFCYWARHPGPRRRLHVVGRSISSKMDRVQETSTSSSMTASSWFLPPSALGGPSSGSRRYGSEPVGSAPHLPPRQ